MTEPIRYTVYSLDMWGHVPAECCSGYSCTCIEVNEETGKETHDDNACTCCEEMNDKFRQGEIEVFDGMTDAQIILALYNCGFLSDHGKDVASVDDYTDGSMLDILDDKGGKILSLETNTAESFE